MLALLHWHWWYPFLIIGLYLVGRYNVRRNRQHPLNLGDREPSAPSRQR